MNKRMILSGGMLVFMAAIVAGGTGAFFSDTETSVGNVFTAGSVSIGFGGIDHVYAYGDGSDPVEGYFSTTTANNIPRFALDDLKPRDAGRLTFDLDNGANEAYVCGLVTGTAPETDPDMALYDNLQFYNSDDDQVTFGSWFDLGTLDANQTDQYEIDYCFGEGQGTACAVESGVDYNAAQNGSFSADLQLFAIQTRNNGNFSCDQLSPEGVYPPISGDEVQPTIGAQVAGYSTPTQCDYTVGSGTTYSTIQSALDAASANEEICVEDGNYPENIVTTADGQIIVALNPQGAVLDGARLLNEGSTLQGFEVTGTTDTAGVGGAAYGVFVKGDNSEVKNNQVTSASILANSQGILGAIGADGLIIHNNEVSGFAAGVFLNPSSNVVLSFNTLTGNNVGSANDGPENNVISRNVFSGNSAESLGYNGDADSGTGNDGSITVEENNFSGGDINQYGTTQLVINDNWLDTGVVFNSGVTNQTPTGSAYPTF